MTLLIANQGLQLLESVGRDYLSSSAEAEKAAEVLLPVISAAIKKQTASKQDLIDFLDKADDATLERYLNAASTVDASSVVSEGESVLSNILNIAGDRSGLIARIASNSNLPAMAISRLLPVVATLAVGAITKSVTQEEKARIRQSLNSPSGGRGFLSIFTSIFSRPSATHAGALFLGKMIESGVSHEEPWVKQAFEQ
ncbi:MAG: DUF937 domain-containing protein [Alphaproteobacteria bacterium]|nr:DUF937 domain-containing protein [Alphaproteobacteria bacterium]